MNPTWPRWAKIFYVVTTLVVFTALIWGFSLIVNPAAKFTSEWVNQTYGMTGGVLLIASMVILPWVAYYFVEGRHQTAPRDDGSMREIAATLPWWTKALMSALWIGCGALAAVAIWVLFTEVL